MGMPVPRPGSGEMNFRRIGLCPKAELALLRLLEDEVPQLENPQAAPVSAASFIKSRREGMSTFLGVWGYVSASVKAI
jgi:hypothetical protein